MVEFDPSLSATRALKPDFYKHLLTFLNVVFLVH